MNLTLNILDVDNKTFSGNYQLSQYGGKELDRENGLDWLDFEARHYDPMLPQFNSIDRKAEDYPGTSPFAYCAGNPIRYNDPTGKDAELVINGNNIVFNVNIILIGKNITDDIINTYKNDLLKTWGTMTSYTSESGIKYDIEWNIDVHALKKGELFNYKNGKNNFLIVHDDFMQSYVKESHFGEITTNFLQGDPLIHEFGHLIGLKDRYHEQKPTSVVKNTHSLPDIGWEGNVMAEIPKNGKVESKNLKYFFKGIDFIHKFQNSNKPLHFYINFNNRER